MTGVELLTPAELTLRIAHLVAARRTSEELQERHGSLDRLIEEIETYEWLAGSP